MLRKVWRGLEYVLGKDTVARDLRVSAEDAFIVSFPGSGATWLQLLLANLTQPESTATWADIKAVIIDTDLCSRKYIRSAPRPRIFNTHQWFHGAYKKVLYLVRDPRDVVLSRFRLQRDSGQIDGAYLIERYVSGFLAGDGSDVGSWWENVLSWLATCYKDPGFRLLRYEDLYENAEDELTKAAGLLCINASRDRIASAVERGSIERMRQLEQTEGRKWRARRRDMSFLAPVEPGQWRTGLPEKSVAEMEKAWGPLMKTLGYELSVTDCAEMQLPFHEPNPLVPG